MHTFSIAVPHGPCTVHWKAAEATQPLQSAPLALLLPAMGSPATYYLPTIEALADVGLHAAVLDFARVAPSPLWQRHHPPGVGYHHWASQLIPQVWDELTQRCPTRFRILIGHSMGGQVGLLHAALAPRPPDALILIGSGTPYWRSYPAKDRRRTLIQTRAMATITKVLRHWPGERFGFGGRQPAAMIRDWAHLVRTNRYPASPDGSAPQAALESLQLPTLAITIFGDGLAPRSSTDALLSMAPRVRTDHVTLGDAHDSPGHNRWARTPGPFLDLLLPWLTGQGLVAPPD